MRGLMRLLRGLSLDLRPLKASRDFRLLFMGQFVSFAGSMITYVAVPYQVYTLTKSTLAVGLLGLAELLPLLVLAFVGGALADAADRRRLVLLTEATLAVISALLAANALLPRPSLAAIYVLAGTAAGVAGLQRPAREAMVPRLVDRELIPAAAALSSVRGCVGMIGGPAVGGLLIASTGLPATYMVDVASFLVSLATLFMMSTVPPPTGAARPSLRSVLEGFRYARSRQELLGTYLVDMVAMFFGMPQALFPALAQTFGGGRALGLLYAAPAAGALLASLASGWTPLVRRHGLAIAIAATLWGLSIVVFGLVSGLGPALVFLGLAGAADAVSGLFRQTIWNQTIPDAVRGRLVAIEQVSYLSGPLLGNVESGLVAGFMGVRFSIVSGGVFCVIGTLFVAAALPVFMAYDSERPPAPRAVAGGSP
ncbi:MAG TPA: MFS transporter [Vicinamibacteria bacterium]|nr:MFS transporter [Vicinamibacteria bacterium]